MKYFRTYEDHSYNKLGHRNQEVRDNNWVGAQGHTFNSKEPAKTEKDAEKILKDKGIKWDHQFETRDGWIHYRFDAEWTDYVVGNDPKTNEPYTGSMSVAAYNPNEKTLWTEPTDMMKDYTKDPHLSEGRPFFQDTPNEFAYLEFKKWAYKNRGKIKKELSKISDGSKFFMKLSDIWRWDWANKYAKEWSALHSTDIARKDFGRALAVMMKSDDLIIKRSTNKLLDLK